MGIGRIFESLWVLLPHWLVGLLAAVVIVAAIPGWRFRRRSSRIQEAVRQLVRAEHDRVQPLIDRLWEQAGDDADLLASAVREARKREIPRVVQEGMARLEAMPTAKAITTRLRAEVSREVPVVTRDLLTSVLRIDAMIEDDRLDAAELALAEAELAWPDERQLAPLRRRLTTRRDTPQVAPEAS